MTRGISRRALVSGGMAALAVIGTAGLALADEKKGGKATSASAEADTVSSASVATEKFKSMDEQKVMAAIPTMKGIVAIATVNEDGSPNLAVFIPSAVGEDFIYFGFAPNATLANLKRTKEAVILYDEYDISVDNPADRHDGARLKVELVEDEKVLDGLKDEMGDAASYATVVKIVEVLPMG